MDDRSWRDRFWDLVCDFRIQLFYLFVMEVVLLLLGLFSLAFVERGTSSYVISPNVNN